MTTTILKPLSDHQIDLMIRAVDHFGFKHQQHMIIEECAELVVALARSQRSRYNVSDVIEEIADVYIMMNQAAIMFGVDEVNHMIDVKLSKLEKYLLA